MITDSRTKYPEVDRIKKRLAMQQARSDAFAHRKQQSASGAEPVRKTPFIPSKTDFYKSREWQELRWKALKASNGCCVYCGRSRTAHGVIMHVDHIKPRSRFPDLALVLSNLQVLCEDCNMGKGTKDA